MDGQAKPNERAGRRFRKLSLRQLLMMIGLASAACGVWFASERTSMPVKTDRDLDLAIFGRGYFQILDPESGQTFYTRNGHFHINANGQFAARLPGDSWLLEPAITVSHDWTDIQIQSNGVVNVAQGGSSSASMLGQIQLASFVTEDGFVEVLPGVLSETDQAGPAVIANPGLVGIGYLMQGWLNREGDARFEITPEKILLAVIAAGLGFVVVELGKQRRAIQRMQESLRDSP